MPVDVAQCVPLDQGDVQVGQCGVERAVVAVLQPSLPTARSRLPWGISVGVGQSCCRAAVPARDRWQASRSCSSSRDRPAYSSPPTPVLTHHRDDPAAFRIDPSTFTEAQRQGVAANRQPLVVYGG